MPFVALKKGMEVLASWKMEEDPVSITQTPGSGTFPTTCSSNINACMARFQVCY